MTQARRDDKIDIEAIMGRIRENVRRKKEAGIYTDADVEDVASRGRAAGDDIFACISICSGATMTLESRANSPRTGA